MELHQVRYFLALASTLNFTRAAEKCNVTQPALTKAVQKLEYELGGDLIHRERQLTQLTDLGKVVLPMLERTLAAAEAARAQALDYRRKEIAPLRVGLAPSISPSLLVEPLAELGRFIPGLRVELTEAPAEELVAALLRGDVNAALIGEVTSLPERIDSWVLFRERYLIAAARQHAVAAHEEVDVLDLAGFVWLERSDCEMVGRLQSSIAEKGLTLKCRHLARQEAHVLSLAAAGLGVVLAPEHAPATSGVVRRPVKGLDLSREVKLLVVAGRRYSPALDALVKIARVRDWTAGLKPAA